MNVFSSIPDHTGFTAKILFQHIEGTLENGAFARMEPGGGGPLAPHRHGHAHLFVVTRGTASVMMDGEERTVRAHESLLVPGGILHSVWNRDTETAEIIGLTLGPSCPSPASPNR